MVEMPNWLAIIIAGAIPIIIYAGRVWVKAFVEGEVRLDVERRVEQVRSDFRQSEERLKADLRSREVDIATLREGVLSGRANRFALVEKRRLEATERLWQSVTKLSRMKGAAMTLATLKIDVVAKRTPRDPKLREFLETLSNTMGGLDLKQFKDIRADEERPFLAEYTWALYSAYAAVIFGGHAIIKILAAGLEEPEKLLNKDHVNNLLKVVLPHHSNFIDEYGIGGHYHLLDELEDKILQELRNALNGVDVDHDNVSQTANIMKAVSDLTNNTAEAASSLLGNI